MSPNRRLIIAVVLSVIFFVGYTAIFPPKDMVSKETQTKSGVANTPQTKSVAQ